MYTTVAFYSGDIKESHKDLQTYKFQDGYAVEENGLYINVTSSEVYSKQRERFANDASLLRIDVYCVGVQKPTTLLR